MNSNFQLFNGFIQIIKTYYKHRTTLKLTVNKYEHGSKPEKSMNERSRKAYFPRMEEKLVQQFKKQRKKGKTVKKWWFLSIARKIMNEEYPKNIVFKYSNRWFNGFCRRNRISLRRKTHTAQKSLATLKDAIQKFHAKLLRERIRGTFQLGDIANTDQTPLPFVLDDGRTYNTTGAEEVWCSSGASGLDKRQCTVELTVFGDGVSRVRPMLIFRGEGKRIKPHERRSWDKRVNVYFQKNAWCDEVIMKKWTSDEWCNIFTNPATPGSSGKLVVADVHKAQQTDEVKRLLQKKNTVLVNVPPGCTSRVQPLDVVVNKPFKNLVREQFEKHLDKNLKDCVEGKPTASKKRILTTKWVAIAWEKVMQDKEMVIRSFKKCGITTNVDGSENDKVKIPGLEGYIMPLPEEEFHLESEDEDDESDGNEMDEDEDEDLEDVEYELDDDTEQ